MDKLPDLILIKILNNLTINNQINLRLLNKRWKSIIDDNLSNCKKELILFFKLLPSPAIWQYNQEQINLKNSIVFNEKVVDSNYFKNLFCKNIERLVLFYCNLDSESSEEKIWMPKINEFINLCSNLIHLQIKDLCGGLCFTIIEEIHINLPNIKTLFVDCGKVERVNLNCPNLMKLSVHYNFEMSDKFTQISNSLKFLKIKSFTYLPGYTLPNLEIIYFCAKLDIDISHFEKLKEIHFFNEFYCLEIDMIIELLNNFLDQKKIYNRDCLKIFYDGIKFQSDTVDFIKASGLGLTSEIPISEGSLKFYLDNQSKLNYLKKEIVFSNKLFEYIDKMNYNQIDNLSKCLVSVDLFGQYNNLKSENKFIDHEYKLINLLKNVRYLRTSPSIFMLNGYELNKIPGIFTNLMRINFLNSPYELQFSHFYFRFLINFKELESVTLFDRMISIEDLGIIIEELKLLDFITIRRWLNFNQLMSLDVEPEKDALFIEIIRDHENNYQIKLSSVKDRKLKFFESKNKFFIYLKEKERIKEKFYDNFLENDYNINFNLNNISKEEYFYLQEH